MNKFGDNWEKDKLNRIEDAKFLSTYLIEKHNANKGSFVLNINAEWGFGKTYFLQNWMDDLLDKNHPVIYFDAWQNDFSKEPLLALISNINEQLTPFFKTPKAQKSLSKWYKTAKKLVAPSAPLMISILAKKIFSMSADELIEYINEEDEASEISAIEDKSNDEVSEVKGSDELEKTVSTVVSKAATKMLETHNSTKETIIKFKDNLEELTKYIDSIKSQNTPIFIFIDELDRCRPDYAIEVLENVKHLFGVPGVYFVIATASEQLSHSIKAIYGQDFDGANYLKRFFDQTYTMNDPDLYSYSEFLFSNYGLDDRENLYSPIDPKLCESKNSVIEAFAWICSIFKCGLRDMEQYCILIDSISLTFKKENIHLVYLLFLIIVKDQNNDKYKNILKTNKCDILTLEYDQSQIKKEYMHTNSYHKKNYTFSQLIGFYLTAPTLSHKYLSDRVNGTSWEHTNITIDISNEILRNPKHYFSEYPVLIDQAGRLA